MAGAATEVTLPSSSTLDDLELVAREKLLLPPHDIVLLVGSKPISPCAPSLADACVADGATVTVLLQNTYSFISIVRFSSDTRSCNLYPVVAGDDGDSSTLMVNGAAALAAL